MFQLTAQIHNIHPDIQPSGENVCLAIIFVIGTKTLKNALMQAKHAITNQPGVDYVRPAGNRTSVLAVHYNRELTSAVHIVQRLRRAGHNAVLVGC